MEIYYYYIEKYRLRGTFCTISNDAGHIFTQENAIKYISYTKYKTIPSTMDILMNYFIPICEMHLAQKAMFLGHMVFKLLRTMKRDKPTDRGFCI